MNAFYAPADWHTPCFSIPTETQPARTSNERAGPVDTLL